MRASATPKGYVMIALVLVLSASVVLWMAVADAQLQEFRAAQRSYMEQAAHQLAMSGAHVAIHAHVAETERPVIDSVHTVNFSELRLQLRATASGVASCATGQPQLRTPTRPAIERCVFVTIEGDEAWVSEVSARVLR